MTLLANGFFDWAVKAPPRVPGGTNGGRNGGKGMIPHSAVGNWDSLPELMEFLEGRITAPEGRRASWAATNMQNGIFYQHFSVWDQTWTSGSGYPNNNFFAFENEGGAYIGNTPNFSEPLTKPQVDNIIHAGRDLMAVQGWAARRPVNSDDRTASLYEHCECVRFGSASTSCPSHRIPWGIIVPALQPQPQVEEDDMPILVFNFDKKVTQLVGFAQPILIGSAQEVIELEKKYGKQIALSDTTIQQMHS